MYKGNWCIISNIASKVNNSLRENKLSIMNIYGIDISFKPIILTGL